MITKYSDKITIREIYYDIYSRKQGEIKYNEFIKYFVNKYSKELSKLGYKNNFDQVGLEIDEVLRLENPKNVCEENFNGILELRVLTCFVNWKKTNTIKYYLEFDYREEMYIGELNDSGRMLICEWNKYLINSIVKEYN